MLELLARDARPVDGPGRADLAPREIHPREVGKRPAGADDACAAPVADWQVGPQRLTHLSAQLRDPAPHGGTSVRALITLRALQILLSHANRAEGQRP